MRPVQSGSDSGGLPFVQLFPGPKLTSWWTAETMYPLYQRKDAIDKLSKRQKVLGERWYLVRLQWLLDWDKWIRSGSKDIFPPVDNRGITDSLGNLASWVNLDNDWIVYVPLEAWKLLVQWYVSYFASYLSRRGDQALIQVWSAAISLFAPSS